MRNCSVIAGNKIIVEEWVRLRKKFAHILYLELNERNYQKIAPFWDEYISDMMSDYAILN